MFYHWHISIPDWYRSERLQDDYKIYLCLRHFKDVIDLSDFI